MWARRTRSRSPAILCENPFVHLAFVCCFLGVLLCVATYFTEFLNGNVHYVGYLNGNEIVCVNQKNKNPFVDLVLHCAPSTAATCVYTCEINVV